VAAAGGGGVGVDVAGTTGLPRTSIRTTATYSGDGGTAAATSARSPAAHNFPPTDAWVAMVVACVCVEGGGGEVWRDLPFSALFEHPPPAPTQNAAPSLPTTALSGTGGTTMPGWRRTSSACSQSKSLNRRMTINEPPPNSGTEVCGGAGDRVRESTETAPTCAC
jgi:hypothetical protein